MTPRKRWRATEAIQQQAKELRQRQTPAEQKLWARLRNHQLDGLGFRRQHPIDPFITDLYCAAHKLVIEIDGHSHGEQIEYDQERTAWLQSQGYQVICFTNDQVNRQMDQILTEIARQCGVSLE